MNYSFETRERKLVTDIEKMSAAPEQLSPPEVFDVNDRHKLDELFDQEVISAIAELPDEVRLALLFQADGGLSYHEISEALECPIGTVMSRLRRGRKMLREQLGELARSYGIGQSGEEGRRA